MHHDVVNERRTAARHHDPSRGRIAHVAKDAGPFTECHDARVGQAALGEECAPSNDETRGVIGQILVELEHSSQEVDLAGVRVTAAGKVQALSR